jgi:hypothetical protein
VKNYCNRNNDSLKIIQLNFWKNLEIFAGTFGAQKYPKRFCSFEGDFSFGDVEAAERKPLPCQATFLDAQTHCVGLACSYLDKRAETTSR